MKHGTPPHEIPADVLDDVAHVTGAEIAGLGRLRGGVNGGAVRVRLAGGAGAVLKVAPHGHAHDLGVVEHMRGHPAWLGVGATDTHVWHLMDVVDAASAAELTPSLVEQLMELIELQAGRASEPNDHWSCAWRVATGRQPAGAAAVEDTREQSRLRLAIGRLPAHSPSVAALVERLRLACADTPPPREAHPTWSMPISRPPATSLVRDGAVVALVELENAGSGTRATDLAALAWHALDDPSPRGSSGWSARGAQRCSRPPPSSTCSRSPSFAGTTTSCETSTETSCQTSCSAAIASSTT